MNDATLLIAAHGSRQTAGNDEVLRFVATLRERHPEKRIEVCFIEHAEVLLDDGLDRAAQGARRVLTIPLILNAAGHVKMELPAAIDAARARHPQVDFALARHLGMGRELLAVLQDELDRQMRELVQPDPQTTGVVLLGRGSSDAGANGELARMARWLFEDNDHELVDLAFTGITWPRLETVVQRQVKLGMTQVCIVPVYLFTGVLIERIAQQVERLRQAYPHVAFALGSYFGFAPALFDLVDARIAGATQGQADDPGTGLLECDGCTYRAAAQAEHLHDHSHTSTGACAHAHGKCN